jgi:hypothetical protein
MVAGACGKKAVHLMTDKRQRERGRKQRDTYIHTEDKTHPSQALVTYILQTCTTSTILFPLEFINRLIH